MAKTLHKAVFTVMTKGRRRVGVMAITFGKTFRLTMSSNLCARRGKGNKWSAKYATSAD